VGFERLVTAGHGLCAALVVLAMSACASPPRTVDDVWVMPGGSRDDADPALAAPSMPRGYAFSRAEAAGRGADTVVDDAAEPGDLPETALGLRGPRGLWREDERAAYAEARELGLPMVVSFWAEWCSMCRRLDAEMLGDAEVTALLQSDFVPLRIDTTEETRRNREQLERYRVVRIPTVLVLDRRGREIYRVEELVNAEVLVARLERARSRAAASR
jgi:thiol-disulfide isomerase/thioredoxin